MAKYLFVVAHPDDDVLGAGAFIHSLKRNGGEAKTIVFNSYDSTRYGDDRNGIIDDLMKSSDIIGLKDVVYKTLRDSEFHNESHRKMVESIEEVIKDFQPDYLFTQNPSDNNTDHYWCAKAAVEAFRYGQRGRYDSKPIRGLFYIEVLSSTDWGLATECNPFRPNFFVPVEDEDIEAKIDALSVYENVLRESPFPRCPETIRALAKVRGSQAGYKNAEAFECAFMRGVE